VVDYEGRWKRALLVHVLLLLGFFNLRIRVFLFWLYFEKEEDELFSKKKKKKKLYKKKNFKNKKKKKKKNFIYR